jgi:hypothetical protein
MLLPSRAEIVPDIGHGGEPRRDDMLPGVYSSNPASRLVPDAMDDHLVVGFPVLVHHALNLVRT